MRGPLEIASRVLKEVWPSSHDNAKRVLKALEREGWHLVLKDDNGFIIAEAATFLIGDPSRD